tara:strand:- start:1291 stop:2100 length:810 start_codon:yes stop_codon:yes gene_type:complete
MAYKNLTIRGKTDGFGCQLNAKYSGIAFCFNHPNYRYIHTPFTTVSHGWRDEDAVNILNDFIGIPDNRYGKRIHCIYRYMKHVFGDPNHFYNTKTLNHIREMYWSTNKPASAKEEIVVHIRRGDVQVRHGGDRRRRYMANSWYNHGIPKLAALYPDSYRIAIHSEGNFEEFSSILNGWPKDLVQRTNFKLAEDNVREQKHSLINTFHEMVTAKVLMGSKSGLSYTSSILCEGDVYFMSSGAKGQRIGLNHWTRINLTPKLGLNGGINLG